MTRGGVAMDMLGAYFRLQVSKPQSVAWLGAGNPVGQAAWIVEQFYDWCDRREKPFDQVFTRDQLLTNVMIYVMTGSFTTGAWYYRALIEEGALRCPMASAARPPPPSPTSPVKPSIRRRRDPTPSAPTTSSAGRSSRAAAISRPWKSRTCSSTTCETGRAGSRLRMSRPLDPVRPIALADIEAARARIAGTILRTPLVRLEFGSRVPRHPAQAGEPAADQRLQAARRGQRGRHAQRGRRAEGVWTISAGNAGQGVAYAARAAGVPCTVVAIETAPTSKLERMRALGAKLVLVSYDGAWKALEDRAFPGRRGHVRAPLRRSQFHRRPRHHGSGDSRGCARHRGRHRAPSAAADWSSASAARSRR